MLFNSHLSLKRLIFFLAIQNVAGVWGSPYIHSQELEPGKIKAPLSLRSHSPRVATPPFSSCDDWLHTKFIARMPTTSGHGQTPMHNTQPGIAVVNGSVDVRWSSELKVHQWILETEVGPALWDQEDEVLWEVTWKAQNNGAKTIIDLPRERGSCIRIIGIDREGKSLGRTNPVKLDEGKITISVAFDDTQSAAIHSLLFCIAMACLGLIFAWILDEYRRRKSEKFPSIISFEDA